MIPARFGSRRSHLVAASALLAGLAAVLRLPFLGTIGPDEGGYAWVALAWARGGHLYGTDWIDRPQGLVLAYRLLLDIAHQAWAIRLGALLAGVAITLLLVAIGYLLESPAVGLTAGLLYAVVGVGPHIEGYTFNGELAAGVPATAAVAAAAVALRRTSLRWFALAGALGACGVLMKQSGFDGLAIALAAAAIPAGARIRRIAVVLGAAAVPLGAALLDGWALGWHAYWSALAGYRLNGAGLLIGSASRVAYFLNSFQFAWHEVLPLAIVAAAGIRAIRWRSGIALLPVVWFLAAFIGFNLGGLYWRHYYVQLVPPLALLAAIGLVRIGTRRTALGVALLAAPVLAFVLKVAHAPDRRSDRMISYAYAYENDQRVAHWVRAHTSARDTVFALESRADFYFLADRRPATPYIWGHPLNEIPGALPSLVRTLSDEGRPKFVVLFQRPGPRLAPVVRRDYALVWRAPRSGMEVLAADPDRRRD